MTTATDEALSLDKPWYTQITWTQWKALIASWAVWTLDGLDFLVLTYVLVDISKRFNVSLATASLLLLITYGVRWLGGLVFGDFSDRVGRRIPLVIALLWFTACAVLTGLSWTWWAIVVFRLMLGVGMAPGYAIGASLITETWPAKYRSIALGINHTGWGFGGVFASLSYVLVYPHFGWRGMFFVGAIPALILTAFILFAVKESPVWKAQVSAKVQSQVASKTPAIMLFQKYPRQVVVLAALLFSLFFNNWPLQGLFPTYLKSLHFNTATVGSLGFYLSIGQIAGFVLSGFLAEWFGRRGGLSLMLLLGMAGVVTLVLTIHWFFWAAVWSFLGGGLLIGSAGIWSVILNENLPTEVRASGVGFLYNVGSFGGGLAPFVVLSCMRTFHLQFAVVLVGFTIAAGVIALLILRLVPETRGTALPSAR